jgi:hypothetical protein
VTSTLPAAGPSRTPLEAPRLFHFTCSHAAASIVACGALVPAPHFLLPRLAPLVWLTSDPCPEPHDVGFPSRQHECDRMEHRFQVLDTSRCERWWELCEQVPSFALPARALYYLETGRRTETWWVARTPVPVVLA